MNNKSVKEILDIFGEYEKAVETINEHISQGETSGSMEWFFFREDYENITEEMEEIFDGEDTNSICIDWELNIS